MRAYAARVVLGIWVGLACLGEAQPRVRSALRHDIWSTESGLPQNSVHEIIQAHDGFLWLATEGGAVRYDGYSFKVYSHDTDPSFTSNDVTSIAEDSRGNLWFGTADGLVEYTSGRTNHFGTAAGLVSTTVLSVTATDDGSILVLTPQAVQRFDGSRFNSLPLQQGSIDSVERQPDGSVILLGGSGAQRYSHGSLSAAQIGTSQPAEHLLGAIAQTDGRIWTWTTSELRASGKGRTLTWHVGQDLPGTKIQTLTVDRDGAAWVGTNRGLSSVVPGDPAHAISELSNQSILSILQDREGDLWIGTDATGLHALRPRTFSAEPALLSEEVTCVAQASDGAIWVGTRQDGLRRIAPDGAIGRPVPNPALTSPFILSLAPGPDGDMWVGTPDGLTHVMRGGVTKRYTSSDGLPDDIIRSLLFARDGTLWVGTPHGVGRLNSGRAVPLTEPTGLATNPIGPIHASANGDLWIGTGSGVFRRHDATLQLIPVQAGRHLGAVTSIAEDKDGHIWIATQAAGLYLWNGNELVARQTPELPSELYAVAADPEGFLWIRSRRKLLRIAAQELVGCASSSCNIPSTSFIAADGLPSDNYFYDSRPSILATNSGDLWVATRKGLAFAHVKGLTINRTPIPVAIEAFVRNDVEVPISAQSFPSASARYTFEYAGLSYMLPSKVLYRTKLEGFDADWTAPTNRRTVSYTNLPPRKYVFRVQAANNDGIWNLNGAELPFEILPPYYRRWWFLLAASCSIVLIGMAVYQRRMRSLRRAFDAVLAERSRIAREIHDTLAQDLVAISLQLNLISKTLRNQNVAAAHKQIEAARNLVTDSLEQARRSIWNLRRESQPTSLPSEVTALAEHLSTDGLKIRTRITGTYRRLPSGIEEELLKIMREAITNVRKHASASEVEVDCHYEGEILIVTVKDDGQGFALSGSDKVGHFGVQGMRERAAAVGGQLSITTAIGAGTQIKVVVPTRKLKEVK